MGGAHARRRRHVQQHRVWVCVWNRYGMPVGLHDLESLQTPWNERVWELARHNQPASLQSTRVVRKPLVILVSSQHGCCGESETARTIPR
jgi:hypothetical protein